MVTLCIHNYYCHCTLNCCISLSGVFKKEEIPSRYIILNWLPFWSTVPANNDNFFLEIVEYLLECSFALLEYIMTLSLKCWHILVNVYLKILFFIFPNSYFDFSIAAACVTAVVILLSYLCWKFCINSKTHSVSRNVYPYESDTHPAMNRHWELYVLCGILALFVISYIWEFIRIYQIERAKKATVLFKVSSHWSLIPLNTTITLIVNVLDLYHSFKLLPHLVFPLWIW